MARIIPTDDRPGAREAGTIDFLDRYLSGLDHIYAKPDGSGFEKLDGRRAQAWQQRLDILRDKYATGVQELDRRGNARFGADLADLTGEQQDQVLPEPPARPPPRCSPSGAGGWWPSSAARGVPGKRSAATSWPTSTATTSGPTRCSTPGPFGPRRPRNPEWSCSARYRRWSAAEPCT